MIFNIKNDNLDFSFTSETLLRWLKEKGKQERIFEISNCTQCVIASFLKENFKLSYLNIDLYGVYISSDFYTVILQLPKFLIDLQYRLYLFSFVKDYTDSIEMIQKKYLETLDEFRLHGKLLFVRKEFFDRFDFDDEEFLSAKSVLWVLENALEEEAVYENQENEYGNDI